MNSKKQIFSLNLMAFIWDYTGIEPSLYMEDGGLIYGQYPEGGVVGEAIRKYRDPDCQVNLHSFLNTYKALREKINALRGVH